MAQETITTKEIFRQSLDRNRYFYGMLMTVRDFTMEQDHFTAKRLLSNRLLFGSGVICGLQVEKSGAEATTIEIKPGVAFDPLGREVTVLEVPGGNKFDLSKVIPAALPLFTGDKKGFICLSHRECPKDPVPSLKSSPCDETCEASRWSETFGVTWEENTSTTSEPSLCEKWLNRTAAVAEDAKFRIERTTPLWVRANEVFEVVVRVTAKQDATNIRITETRTGGSLIEPTPPASGTGQFPTPPVNLKAGEFFVYVYQVKSPAAVGSFQLALNTVGLPLPTSTVEVLSEANAKLRESELTVEVNSGEPAETCVRIAELTVHFTASIADNISDIRNLGAPRFRYTLERVTEMLDCLRASLLAEAGSARPGHALITFNDLETSDLKPIGATAAHGASFTVPHGDHVHALLRHEPSGLKFTGAGNNELWINGDVGGEAINFLYTVAGQDPVEPQHLVTKRYVDAHIAGLDWQESVLDKDLTSPPIEFGKGVPKKAARKKVDEVPPADGDGERRDLKEGDRYLLFNEPEEKPWAGHQNDIATFNGKSWDFTTPDEGTATFVEDENVAYMFVDGSWIPFLASPEITAGDGLLAAGAILSVGQGKGIVVNPNDVAIAFEAAAPQPVGPTASAGSHETSARGDHTHELALAEYGGLDFSSGALQINGPVAGDAIEFQNVVSGQPPTEKNHLATKSYVDEHQSTITAGAGLVRTGDVISVNPGAGIRVTRDVAVAFQTVAPQPIGPVANAGIAALASPGDHVHRLPLAANSGLEFAGGELRLNGLVAGAAIDFQNAVSGQTPTDMRHLATKKYVDDKVVPTGNIVAGKGLTKIGDTLAVGEGSGLLVEEDAVSVRFSSNTPSPDSARGDPGNEQTASRGDHSHPPPLNTTGATSGLVTFTIEGQAFVAHSGFIDPGLRDGTIGVQLALTKTRSTDSPDTYFFDTAGQFSELPPIKLGAEVRMGKPTTFRIWAWIDTALAIDPSLVREQQGLPKVFQVRWFAYWPGIEILRIEVPFPPKG